ncbi:MAG TPA: lysoplasmalogenase [Microlunatus sp.]|nr:lysoplasmalogenase [Microlunatus sp.]
MPRRSSRAALACFGAVAAVDLVAEFSGWQPIALVCRMLLMPLLAWCCWTGAVRRTRLVILVLVALGFSWLGDLSAAVLIKIGFFLIAQIVYVVAFLPSWRRSLIARPPLAIAYALALGGLIGVVTVAAGPLAGPVAVYGASLAVMAVLATGVDRLTGIGGALFLLSDIVLAVELFVAPGAIPYALFVNMALYLPAQLMITLGVLERVSAEVESTVSDPVA